MTTKELNQYRALEREIKDLQRRKRELMDRATATTAILTGMPHGGGTSDKVGDLGADIAWYQIMIDTELRKANEELRRLCDYINNIPDRRVKTVMRLRYIDGKSWAAIAFEINEFDATYPLKMVQRYLQGGSFVRNEDGIMTR